MREIEASAIDSIEKWIRKGRLRKAREQILSLNSGTLDRKARLKLAFLCCTGGAFPKFAAQLLHRRVRGTERRPADATEEEMAEYAKALIWLGATEEAIALLLTLDRARLPRVNQFLAWAYFRRWDWDSALPLLEEALGHERLTQSDRMGLLTIYGNALIHGPGRFSEARKVLHEVLGETGIGRFPLFHWDALQVLGQSHYLEGDWKSARRCLDQADQFLRPERDDTQDLMTRKFQALMDLRAPASRSEARRKLGAIRERFLDLENWEQARSCDYYAAIELRDERLLARLYHGTPHPAFRSRLLREFDAAEADIPPTCLCPIGGRGPAQRRPVLDALTGAWNEGVPGLKRGQLVQRLLEALTSDLWCPASTARLHQALYPDERYDPRSSPVRVRQAIARLRRWLTDPGAPLEVVYSRDRYALASRTGVSLRLHLRPSLADEATPIDPKLRDLLSEAATAFGGKSFAARELQGRIGLSRATAVALLNSAVELGRAEKLGSGPQTRYKLTQ